MGACHLKFGTFGIFEFLVKIGDSVCAYTGISIVDTTKIKNLNPVKEDYIILNDKRIAFNLNTKHDYELL